MNYVTFLGPYDDVVASALTFSNPARISTNPKKTDVRIFLQTDKFTGDITTQEGEFALSNLMKDSRVLLQFQQAVSTKNGEKG